MKLLLDKFVVDHSLGYDCFHAELDEGLLERTTSIIYDFWRIYSGYADIPLELIALERVLRDEHTD